MRHVSWLACLALASVLAATVPTGYAATPQPKMEVKSVDISPAFEDLARRTRDELDAVAGRPVREAAGDMDLKALLADMGVTWPEGSLIRYVRSIGRLIVRNTPENVKRIEELIEGWNLGPSQIEIEVQFVEFDMADIDALSREGMITPEGLAKLRGQGKSRLIAAPRVVTQAGQEATTQGGTEYIYPTEFEVKPVEGGGTNAADSTDGLIQPGSFETREIGAILSVMPQVTPDGNTIILTMSPEHVCEPTWKDYGDKSGSGQAGSMEQPFFHSYATTTQIGLRDGATVVMGGGMNSRDGKKVVYLFVSARRVDTEGKPSKKRAVPAK